MNISEENSRRNSKHVTNGECKEKGVVTNMKNIVVLRNLPSNLVEEAIVVLKSNKKIKKPEYIDKKSEIKNKETESQDYIIKEAEMIIANFIKTVEKPMDKQSKIVVTKYKRLKIITVVLGILTLINLVTNFIK